MKNLFLSLVLVLSFKAMAQIENDKILHFVGGNLYGLAGAGIAKQISKGDRFWTFAGAIGGSALVGLGKEAIDSNPNGSGWDNGDLLATILGGATVGITIDIFTDHKRGQKTQPQSSFSTKSGDNFQFVFNPTSQNLPTYTELAMPNLFINLRN